MSTTAVDLLTDYLYAGAGRKDPAVCLEVAYRRAYQTAEISGDWSDSALRTQLTKWPIPGAYDDADGGRLSVIYQLWREGRPPEEIRELMQAPASESKRRGVPAIPLQ